MCKQFYFVKFFIFSLYKKKKNTSVNPTALKQSEHQDFVLYKKKSSKAAFYKVAASMIKPHITSSISTNYDVCEQMLLLKFNMTFGLNLVTEAPKRSHR